LAWLISEQFVGIADQITEIIVRFTILIIAAVTIHHVCWFLWKRLTIILFLRVTQDLRESIINEILNKRYKEIEKNSSGFYIERLWDSVERIAGYFENVTGSMVDVATNLSFLIVIYILNWQLGLFFSIGIIILLLIEVSKIKKDTVYLAKTKDIFAKVTSNYNETIAGAKDIKGLGIKTFMNKRNVELQQQKTAIEFKKASRFDFLSKLKSYTQWMIDAALVFTCAFWLFPTGQISVAVLFMIYSYKNNAYDTVGYFSTIKQCYMQGDLGAKQVLEITEGLQSEKWGTQDITVSKASVEVKDLSFSYEEESVLKSVSFNIAPNSCSVFVGASGSGKTTLFSLLAKILEVADGKIFIGGTDINSMNEESFRRVVCIVNQEPVFWSDTIAANIKIVRPNATHDEIVAACTRANIHEEISGFPGGYETVINENGANLSGGQRQRIAIARAILKDTPIILFDEPTSALDRKNHAAFFDTLRELKKTKTILVIAHKLNSYELFDNVFEVEGGKIVQSNVNR